jgi:tetratricopeptide (TPR) repeat protein
VTHEATTIVTVDATMVPDYYARLGVDPKADRAEIDAALQRKQPAWSMGTRNPKTRHANQLYLDEIPALRRALLGDPASRAAYDAELAVSQRAERDRKLDELQRRVRLRAAKGGLGQTDRGLLIDEATRLGLDEDDLVRITRPIPNLVEAPSANGNAELDLDPPADVLDPSTRRQIRMALEHLGCHDLYHALGLTRDAPASDTIARADAERQRWMKKAQVTAEKTAWLEIITHAQSHLGSARSRARYDRTLALEAEESFHALAEFALKGLKRLDPGTRAALVEEAAALGIVADRADRLIGRLCRRLDITRDGGSVVPMPNPGSAATPSASSPSGNGAQRFTILRCRHCGGVTELSPVARKAGSVRCPHCGTSLRWDCPVCKRTPWVDEPQCPCGFRMAMREPVLRHFEAAQQCFRTFDLAGSLEHLERVLELAPSFPGARNGIARVRQRQAGLTRVKVAYEAARAGGKLAAARRAVEAWSRLTDPLSPEIQSAWSELTPILRRAEALARKARKVERSDPPAARNLYRQALDIAADLPDALAGLARTPPDPPVAMDAQVLGDRIRLIWTPPPPDGLGPLTFAVVRKRNGTLEHSGDGTRIAEVGTCEFDDTLVTPGETVGYAVLSRRGGVDSIGAISLGPFVFLADVKDVRVGVREREAEFTWSPPRGIAEIRVIRKRGGPPVNPKDGDRIASTIDHAIDRDIAADQDYYYAIHAIYRMPDGRLFPSPGVVVSARPQPTVAVPEAPRLIQEPTGRVRIDWIEPVRGSIRILRTPHPLPLPAGARLAAAEGGSLDGHWIEPAAPDRAYDPDPTRNGLSYYTPVAVWGDAWTVGHGAVLSRVPDPSELRATRAGSGLGSTPDGIRVTLRWRWNAEAMAALVVARQGAPPQGPSDPLATTANVPRADYERHDCWTFSLPTIPPRVAGGPARGSNGTVAEPVASEGGPWYIRVYSVAQWDGVRTLSPGLEPSAATILPGPHPEVTVSYRLKKPWVPGLPWSLTFRTEPAGSILPAMVVVANPRAVPLSVDDGEIVARVPAVRNGTHFSFRTPFKLAGQGVRVFPDPGVEPDAQVPIRFRHPETGSTRV